METYWLEGGPPNTDLIPVSILQKKPAFMTPDNQPKSSKS